MVKVSRMLALYLQKFKINLAQVDDIVKGEDDAAVLRDQASMLRHNAVVQMLTERSVLADMQLNRSDRISVATTLRHYAIPDCLSLQLSIVSKRTPRCFDLPRHYGGGAAAVLQVRGLVAHLSSLCSGAKNVVGIQQEHKDPGGYIPNIFLVYPWGSLLWGSHLSHSAKNRRQLRKTVEQ